MRHRFTFSTFSNFLPRNLRNVSLGWVRISHRPTVGFGEKKKGLLAKGWWKMMCFSFGGWVGQNWMGIGQKYPEITLSTLDLFLKRDVCIIYIFLYIHINVSFNIYNIDGWYHTGPNVQLKTETHLWGLRSGLGYSYGIRRARTLGWRSCGKDSPGGSDFEDEISRFDTRFEIYLFWGWRSEERINEFDRVEEIRDEDGVVFVFKSGIYAYHISKSI